jgi:DNA (cytosine-5)-methyltransferase 1
VAKKSVKDIKDTRGAALSVLVGTFRKENEEWIKEKKLYNLPLPPCGKVAFHENISRVVLIADGFKSVAYEAKFREVVDAAWLKENGYKVAASDKAHGSAYALYELGEELSFAATLSNPAADVFVSSQRCPNVKIDAAFYAKPYPKRGGKSMPYIFDKLKPYFKKWHSATTFNPVQLDFFESLSIAYQVTSPIKHSFVDLFAGCGGLSLGMEKAGFTPVLVNELNNDALSTYLLNRQDEFPWLREHNVNNVKDLVLKPELLQKFTDSIKDKLKIDCEKGELDLLCGGPPCQGFSGIGHRRSYSVEKAQLPSNYLFQDMAFLINKLQPKIFLFENVRGLLTSKWTKDGENGEIFKMVLETFHRIGKYNICYKLVHAKDYGVPQNRPRILIVGLRKDVFPEMTQNDIDAVVAGFLPKPTGGAPDLKDLLGDLMDTNYQNGGRTVFYSSEPTNEIQREFRTRRDGSLMGKKTELLEQEYSKHAPKVLAKFKAMHENGGIIPDEFRTKKFSQRLLPSQWGENGPSITACSAPDDYVHFAQPRGLTVREWARLQMFPDWYQFSGPRTTGGLRRAGNPREGIFDRELPKYTQIGNAVPVGLAYRIGQHFIHLLEARNVKSRKCKD